MKKHEFIFSLLRIPIDFLSLYFAFYIAKEIRLITDWIPGVILPIQTIESWELGIFALFGSFLYIWIFAIHRIYTLNLTHSKLSELVDIIRYGVYWFLFFSVGVYLWNGILYSEAEIPRLIILFTMILWILWSIVSRIILNIFQAYLLKKGSIEKRNLLLISNINSQKISEVLEDIKQARVYSIIWYINEKELLSYPIPYINTIEEIERIFSEWKCDEVLFIWSDFSKKKEYEIWELSRIYGIRYRYITNGFDITKTNTSLSLIHKMPVIELANTPLQNWNRVWKRFFDLIASSFLLILTLPISLIIILLIKLEDPSWPAIYKNTRIWQNWKLFNCYKFRYIKWKYCIKESYGITESEDKAIKYEKKLIQENNSRTDGPLYKIKDDPRKTRIGYFLEKYSLDEFPQFFNVFLWEMSIVWPRPHQPREVKKYKKHHKRLLTIKPGITGMAQVNGREQNNFEKEAKLDIFYIENWSFLLDLKIMLKTFSIILNRK